VVIADFLTASATVLRVPGLPRILFQHNVESIIRRRHFEATSSPPLKGYLWWEWVRLQRFEREAARAVDHSITVSDRDRQTMKALYGVENVSSIPTGVDVDYFATRGPESAGNHLVFTGSMDWFANEDAVTFFVDEILPHVRRELAVTFWVVGRTPTERVLRLAREHADVRVTGSVPDVRPYIDGASVYVVPLRIGGGTRIKIFEAMAMSKPVVSTTIGAEGLPVTPGRDVVLSDEPVEFAREVVRLLRSREARGKLGAAARRLVVDNYTWDVAAQRFSEICENVCARGSRSTA
jgi:glycosyltransferase involved in cell wall biosynthesis